MSVVTAPIQPREPTNGARGEQTPRRVLRLDGNRLTVDQVWRIAHRRLRCKLSVESKQLMQRSRDLVDKLVAEDRAVYGINTGFGPLSGERVSAAELELHQVNLIHHLSCGQGELLTDVETRAVMVARANALARGFSGIRVTTVERLLAALEADLLPEIPRHGSVGASGDLIPLAHMTRLLMGTGYARLGGTAGTRVPAAEGLRACGIEVTTLGPKEGLALVNGTSIMSGLAALSVHESKAILGWMELLCACMIQVLHGAPEILCDELHRARGQRGQTMTAERIGRYLRTHAGYKRSIDENQWGSTPKSVAAGVEIQDPYTLRCAPQILGAFQDALWHIEDVVRRELNASTDNPLVFPEIGAVIHGGNFYGQHVSFVCDYLKIGLIKLALLSERQTERLLNWKYSRGLPPMLTGARPGLNTGMGGVGLLATSLAAEARLQGLPASTQTIPTNANNQDVVSMGCHAARQTRTVLPLVWTLLAIQALAVTQAADLRDDPEVMGADFRKLHGHVRRVSERLGGDRPLGDDVVRVVELLQDPAVQADFSLDRPGSPAVGARPEAAVG